MFQPSWFSVCASRVRRTNGDSFYEYLLKMYVLWGDVEYWDMFIQAYTSVQVRGSVRCLFSFPPEYRSLAADPGLERAPAATCFGSISHVRIAHCLAFVRIHAYFFQRENGAGIRYAVRAKACMRVNCAMNRSLSFRAPDKSGSACSTLSNTLF